MSLRMGLRKEPLASGEGLFERLAGRGFKLRPFGDCVDPRARRGLDNARSTYADTITSERIGLVLEIDLGNADDA